MTILQFIAGQLPAQCSQIPLGIRAENDVTQVELDFSAWAEEYGAGVVQLLIRREGDAAPYPVLLSQSGSVAVWTVSATDLAVRGPLAVEWLYTVGTQVKKSEVLPFYVLRDIGTAGAAPDPYEDWLQQLTALAADAQAASLAIQDMGVEAETLAPGSAATVSKTVDPETGAVTLTFGIPRGQDGGGGGQQLIVHGTGANSLISVNSDDPNTASGAGAIALGAGCEASALSAFAVGVKSIASGAGAIAIGLKLNQRDPNRATGLGAVAIGASNESSGKYSVALGGVNTSSGNYSFASGYLARAIGNASVALGRGVEALGRMATAIGDYVKATGAFSAVFGKYNVPDDAEADADGKRKYAFIVGNGTDEEHRSNAATIDWDGNAAIAGKLTLGAGPSENMDVATKKYVDDSIPTVPSASDATPQALGTAAAGSSENYSRADHVHAMPSASDVGAVAENQGSGNAGKFLVVGSDGAVNPVSLSVWQGGNYGS